MKKELMSELGLSEGDAARAIGTLSGGSLGRLLDAARADPSRAKQIGEMVPDVVAGRTTLDAVLAVETPNKVEPPKTSALSSSSFGASEPAAWREQEPLPPPTSEAPEVRRKKR